MLAVGYEFIEQHVLRVNRLWTLL